MDYTKILTWNKLPDNTIIRVQSGQSLYQGHIELNYPEFHGKKENCIPWYKEQLSHLSEAQLNDIYYNILCNYSVVNLGYVTTELCPKCDKDSVDSTGNCVLCNYSESDKSTWS